MEAQVAQNTFCTYTGHPSETDTTVFFVSGNPGLISYYHPFLSLLAQNLADDHKDPAPISGKPASCQIYGNSLGGFEIDTGDRSSPSSAPDNHGDDTNAANQKPELYDLEDQIHFVHRNLHALMAANAAPDSESESPRRRKVILIGHSVGAYITMEILRRHREAKSSPTSKDQSWHFSTDFDVVGGILLFPTVMDIASSPSGRKLTVCILPFSLLAICC